MKDNDQRLSEASESAAAPSHSPQQTKAECYLCNGSGVLPVFNGVWWEVIGEKPCPHCNPTRYGDHPPEPIVGSEQTNSEQQ